MAEGGSVGPSNTVRGSDETFLHNCDPCKFDGTVTEGVGFCEECEEYLCVTCLNVHKKSKALRSHKLVEGGDIHKARKDESPCPALQYCKTHRDQDVNLYCRYHDEVICDLCRSIDHRKCTDVTSIADVCDGLQTDQTVTRVLDNTRSLLAKFKSLEQEQRDDLTGIYRQMDECSQKAGSLRCALKNRLDQEVMKFCNKLTSFITVQSNSINANISTLENVTKAVENETKQLEKARESGRTKLVFIATKNIDVQKLEEVYSDMERERKDIKMDFNTDIDLGDLLRTGRFLPCLELHSSSKIKDPVIMNNAKGKTMTKVGDLNMYLDGETKSCYITAIKFLPGGEVLVCDSNNDKLKLADDMLSVKSSVKLAASPWDVALVGDKDAVVTKPHQQKIQFVTLAPRLQLKRNVNVGRTCWGIATSKLKDRIYVSCHNDPGEPELLVLDMQGVIQTRVELRQDAMPLYIAVDEVERLYLSDDGPGTLICMNSSFQTIYTYSDMDLNAPGQLVVDSNQYVYVCGYNPGNVQVINDKGLKFDTILTPANRLLEPCSLAFRSSDGTLALGKRADRVFFFRYV